MPKKGEFKAGASKRSKAQRKFNSKPEQKKKRASRNAARAKMVKSGSARKGDGKDVDHKNGNPKQNGKKNLRMQSKKTNRSFPRNKRAGKK